MRNSKLFFAAIICALFTSFSTFANDLDVNPDEIRKEIVDMVKTIDISDMEKQYERTYVQFIVNSKNEIVVVNVSKREFAERIKNKLNYKKLKTEDVQRNEIYTVPLVFKKQ
ncbi:hypothetical protein [Portibacter marinus]|uniref:hypothetical protein n=1 Tax=Portibacter marinus TaxID=2898660 RepID=UPI001F357B65|nr:hypothetical protein [Portibacter marinus]